MVINMNRKATIIFIIIEAVIFLAYMALDLFCSIPTISNIFKFIGIMLCLIYSIVMIVINKLSEDRIYIQIIFTLTVCADVFLLLINKSLYGVIIFSVVQSIYLLWFISITCRMPGKNEIIDRSGRKQGFKKRLVIHLVLRIIATLLILILINISSIDRDILLCFTAFYAVSFIDNIYLLIAALVRKRYHGTSFRIPQLLVGMLLFLLCDISVALFNMSAYLGSIASLEPIIAIASVTMWFFYLPSQVLIVTSRQ